MVARRSIRWCARAEALLTNCHPEMRGLNQPTPSHDIVNVVDRRVSYVFENREGEEVKLERSICVRTGVYTFNCKER